MRSKIKTILIVEDEVIIAMKNISFLESSGYNVIYSVDSDSALVNVKKLEYDIDLILMDIDLGRGMNGIDTAKLILDSYDIPIVFLTSFTNPAFLAQLDNLPTYGYVLKNSGTEVLLATMKMAFKLYEAHMATKTKIRVIEISQKLSHHGSWELDISTGSMEWSDEFIRICGYEEISFKPTLDRFFKIIHPEDKENAISIVKQSIENDTPYDFQLRIIRKDGQIRFVQASGEVIKANNGNPDMIVGSILDVTDRVLKDAKIKSLLLEKELLLKEVHHRIKNNMDTIYSLLTLQSFNETNPLIIDSLQSAATRVQSMMILYNKLYRSNDHNTASMRSYIPTLMEEVLGIFPQSRSISIVTDIDDIVLTSEKLSPLGIIINELTTNSIKYAFDNYDGEIDVKVVRDNGEVSVRYKDNGKGLPEHNTLENSNGFGIQLIDTLVKQIDGRVEIERDCGTIFTIRFPL